MLRVSESLQKVAISFINYPCICNIIIDGKDKLITMNTGMYLRKYKLNSIKEDWFFCFLGDFYARYVLTLCRRIDCGEKITKQMIESSFKVENKIE